MSCELNPSLQRQKSYERQYLHLNNKTNRTKGNISPEIIRSLKLLVVACLFDYTQVIKHNYFIKTGERLWPTAAEAVAQAGVIWYSLTTVNPHSITRCSKSCGPSRVQWKRSTRERATLIKAPLNLTISVRYRRAITPEQLMLPFSCSYSSASFSLSLYRYILFVSFLF